MGKIVGLIFFFFTLSLQANQGFTETLLNYAQTNSTEPIEIEFSDGFRQRLSPPIEYYEDTTAGPFRCPCKEYVLRFRNAETGATEERRIQDEANVSGGPNTITWYNGRQRYTVSQVYTGDNIPPAPTCILEGSYDRMYLHSRKMIQNTGRDCPINGTISCVGEVVTSCTGVMRCENDSDYGSGRWSIYCMAQEGQCPTDIKTCAADEALDRARAELEAMDMEVIESRRRTLRQ